MSENSTDTCATFDEKTLMRLDVGEDVRPMEAEGIALEGSVWPAPAVPENVQPTPSWHWPISDPVRPQVVFVGGDLAVIRRIAAGRFARVFCDSPIVAEGIQWTFTAHFETAVRAKELDLTAECHHDPVWSTRVLRHYPGSQPMMQLQTFPEIHPVLPQGLTDQTGMAVRGYLLVSPDGNPKTPKCFVHSSFIKPRESTNVSVFVSCSQDFEYVGSILDAVPKTPKEIYIEYGDRIQPTHDRRTEIFWRPECGDAASRVITFLEEYAEYLRVEMTEPRFHGLASKHKQDHEALDQAVLHFVLCALGRNQVQGPTQLMSVGKAKQRPTVLTVGGVTIKADFFCLSETLCVEILQAVIGHVDTPAPHITRGVRVSKRVLATEAMFQFETSQCLALWAKTVLGKTNNFTMVEVQMMWSACNTEWPVMFLQPPLYSVQQKVTDGDKISSEMSAYFASYNPKLVCGISSYRHALASLFLYPSLGGRLSAEYLSLGVGSHEENRQAWLKGKIGRGVQLFFSENFAEGPDPRVNHLLGEGSLWDMNVHKWRQICLNQAVEERANKPIPVPIVGHSDEHVRAALWQLPKYERAITKSLAEMGVPARIPWAIWEFGRKLGVLSSSWEQIPRAQLHLWEGPPKNFDDIRPVGLSVKTFVTAPDLSSFNLVYLMLLNFVNGFGSYRVEATPQSEAVVNTTLEALRYCLLRNATGIDCRKATGIPLNGLHILTGKSSRVSKPSKNKFTVRPYIFSKEEIHLNNLYQDEPRALETAFGMISHSWLAELPPD